LKNGSFGSEQFQHAKPQDRNRVKREFVDSETGDPVERDEQVKGYEIEKRQYISLESDEVAAAVPDSDKSSRSMPSFRATKIDDVYFDKPYDLAPDKMGTPTPSCCYATG
jgi:DNA end-binding protein Ku